MQTDAAAGFGDPENITVGQHLDKWLQTMKGNTAESTWVRYEQIIRLQIKPHLGRIQLAKLAPVHVANLYSTLQKEGTSARVCQFAGIVLGRALKDAVALKLIPYNPAREVRKPRPQKKELQTGTELKKRANFERQRSAT
jgi:hypothetical protein